MTKPLPGSPLPPEQLLEEHRDWTWAVAYQHGPESLVYRVRGATVRRAFDAHFIKLA